MVRPEGRVIGTVRRRVEEEEAAGLVLCGALVVVESDGQTVVRTDVRLVGSAASVGELPRAGKGSSRKGKLTRNTHFVE